jgi:hypothetical protein
MIDCRARLYASMGFELKIFNGSLLDPRGAQKLDVAQFDLAAIPAPQTGDTNSGTTGAKVARLILAIDHALGTGAAKNFCGLQVNKLTK